MEPVEIIREWIVNLDSLIDRVAIDPSRVKEDKFLRRLFELAFPPEGLPEEIRVKKGDPKETDAIVEALKPYYDAKKSTKTVTKPASSEVKTTSQAILRLKDFGQVGLVLVENGLIRRDVLLPASPGTLPGKRGGGGHYRKIVSMLLQAREHQQEELSRLERLEGQAVSRGDLRSAQIYKEQRLKFEEESKIVRSISESL
jgi:hypothetical protein